MPYYVPLGVRGLILRVGAYLTGIVGSFIYWRGARRRAGARRAATGVVAGPHRGVDRPKVAA